MTQELSQEEIDKLGEIVTDQRNGSLFLFNCLIWIAAVSPLYFPEDQQKEARVLIKEVKEKLRKLRSMLGGRFKMRAKDFDRKKFILEEWPEALESGEFRQTEGTLYDEKEKGYCCLGVACELLTRKRLLYRSQWAGLGHLPEKAVKLLSIPEDGSFGGLTGSSLAGLNDEGETFKKLAKKIRSIEKKKEWDEVEL